MVAAGGRGARRASRRGRSAPAQEFELEKVWCVKVETGTDGVAWLELEAESRAEAIGDETMTMTKTTSSSRTTTDELAGAVIVPIGADEQPPTEEVDLRRAAGRRQDDDAADHPRRG